MLERLRKPENMKEIKYTHVVHGKLVIDQERSTTRPFRSKVLRVPPHTYLHWLASSLY